MSSLLLGSRYICRQCLRNVSERGPLAASSHTRRSASSISTERRSNPSSAEAEKPSVLRKIANTESESALRAWSDKRMSASGKRVELVRLERDGERVEVRRRPPGRIRGGRSRKRSNEADELETLANSAENVSRRVRADKTGSATENTTSAPGSTTNAAAIDQSADIDPSNQKNGSAVKRRTMKWQDSITSIMRPDPQEMQWYWQTFPPTFQERSYADHFFSPKESKVQPKLLTSAALFRQVPESDVPEVAFVGRSNVGKSSLLNALVGSDIKKLLARTSSTPGFTKTMNMYGYGWGNGITLTNPNNHPKIVGRKGLVLVDMPGYGEGSLSTWGVEIMKYIQSRKQLRRVFVLLDAEHGIKDKDRSLLASLRLAGVSHQVIISKVDRLYIPNAKDVKRQDGSKWRKVSHKGSVADVRTQMDKMKNEIQPPIGGGALGEILACSGEVSVDGKRFGIDHVRYAVLKAVGLHSLSKRSGEEPIAQTEQNDKEEKVIEVPRRIETPTRSRKGR